MVAILALSLPLAPIARARPAAAHVCALPAQVAVGRPATVSVGIGAEAHAVTAVELGIPTGFRVTGAGGQGWRSEVEGEVVRFDGNRVEPFSCGYVTVEGVAEQRARLVFPLTLRTAEGDTVTYDRPEPYREDGAQLVYAGLDLPTPPGSDGVGPLEIVSLALSGAGTCLAAVLVVAWLRSRRDAPV
jgi:hypothetical protein